MTQLRNPKAEASAWFERLGRLPITTEEIREFFAWRTDPANQAAYQVVEKAGLRLRGRFVAIPDPGGCGVSQDDADEIREILNRRGAQADGSGRPN